MGWLDKPCRRTEPSDRRGWSHSGTPRERGGALGCLPSGSVTAPASRAPVRPTRRHDNVPNISRRRCSGGGRSGRCDLVMGGITMTPRYRFLTIPVVPCSSRYLLAAQPYLRNSPIIQVIWRTVISFNGTRQNAERGGSEGRIAIGHVIDFVIFLQR